MSIQRAEQLKREWTDKCVMVQSGIPELRRFDKLIGHVKTVNMNCRLLIEFDTPADISWYDIAPECVRVVDEQEVAAQQTSAESSSKNKGTPAAPKASPAKAVSGAGGGSPLDKIRQQNSGGGGAVSPLQAIRSQSNTPVAQPAAEKAVEEKQPSGQGSPLDRIRAQAVGAQAAPKPSGVGVEQGSPLDRIRAQAVGAQADSSPASPTAPKADKPVAAATPPKSADDDAVGERHKSAAKPISTAPSSALANQTDVAPAGMAVAPLMGHVSDESNVGPEKEEVASVATPATMPAETSVAPGGNTPFDQVRRQAAESDGKHSATAARPTPIFDQVRRQAASDDADAAPQSPLSVGAIVARPATSVTADADLVGEEDPVHTTFRGKKLPKKDDLTIVEGIGPKIAELFNNDGIVTWEQLSQTDLKRLKDILEAAGPRFRIHNPETWPAQAQLAADGKWQELEQYQDVLDGGRPPEQS